MPNLNLKKETHELNNVSMFIHVSMAFYLIEFSLNENIYFWPVENHQAKQYPSFFIPNIKDKDKYWNKKQNWIGWRMTCPVV